MTANNPSGLKKGSNTLTDIVPHVKGQWTVTS